MCEFFSCVATRDGQILFTEEDSHQTVIDRAGLKDRHLKDRDFVRLEIIPRDEEWNFQIDEEGTLPEWFNQNLASLKAKALRRAKRVKPHRNAAEDALKPHWQNLCESNNKAGRAFWRGASTWDEFYEERESIREEYEKAKKEIIEEYAKAIRKIPGYVSAR